MNDFENELKSVLSTGDDDDDDNNNNNNNLPQMFCKLDTVLNNTLKSIDNEVFEIMHKDAQHMYIDGFETNIDDIDFESMHNIAQKLVWELRFLFHLEKGGEQSSDFKCSDKAKELFYKIRPFTLSLNVSFDELKTIISEYMRTHTEFPFWIGCFIVKDDFIMKDLTSSLMKKNTDNEQLFQLIPTLSFLIIYGNCDFSGLGISYLPPEICCISVKEKLDFSKNKIQTIPITMSGVRFGSLDLSENELHYVYIRDLILGSDLDLSKNDLHDTFISNVICNNFIIDSHKCDLLNESDNIILNYSLK